MVWKCPRCGFENDAAGNHCGGGCGFVRMAKRVILTTEITKLQLRMHVSTLVGRTLLKSLDSSDGVYASEPQFEIIRDETLGAWAIRHAALATNPTFYNGEMLNTEPHPLTNDGTISIGPDRLKLRVVMED